MKFEYYDYYFGSYEYSWKYILPALPIGVPLYVLKRLHIGTLSYNAEASSL